MNRRMVLLNVCLTVFKYSSKNIAILMRVLFNRQAIASEYLSTHWMDLSQPMHQNYRTEIISPVIFAFG